MASVRSSLPRAAWLQPPPPLPRLIRPAAKPNRKGQKASLLSASLLPPIRAEVGRRAAGGSPGGGQLRASQALSCATVILTQMTDATLQGLCASERRRLGLDPAVSDSELPPSAAAHPCPPPPLGPPRSAGGSQGARRGWSRAAPASITTNVLSAPASEGLPLSLRGRRTPAVVEQAQDPRRLPDSERVCRAEGGTARRGWPVTSISQMGRLRTDTGKERLKVTSGASRSHIRV